MRTTSVVAEWAQWLDAWVAAGDVHARIAEDAASRGRVRTAGEAFVRAAIYYHFAKHQWVEDEAKYRATTDLSVATLRRGMPLLDPTFERVEVAAAGVRVIANVRRPEGSSRPPVVVLVPGLDSTKEEFPAWEETFLRRGIATASCDGPGQGEAGYDQPMRPDYEVAVSALLDALCRRDDLDRDRIGIAGLALGNYYAARAAASDPRIKAVAVIGGPYTLEARGERSLRKLMHSARLTDDDAARAFASRFTLAGVTERIAQPYLVVHGGKDRSFPWQDAERKAREAKRGEFVLYPEGGTACYTVDNVAKPFVADWLREKLA